MRLNEYFGFTTTPFTKEIAPCSLYHWSSFAEAVARITYVAQNRLVGLLTGQAGSGKSCAVRQALHQLDPHRHLPVYLADSAVNPRAFYRLVLAELGVHPPASATQARRQFEQVVLNLYQEKHTVLILVLDEAHLLTRQMLEEIRFITNFACDSLSPLGLILVGQPELKNTLQLKMFEAVSQRVALRYHLQPLNFTETREYLQHHLEMAGAKKPIFSQEAIEGIYHATQGLPRVINLLAHACLLDAMTRDSFIVDGSNLERALIELREG